MGGPEPAAVSVQIQRSAPVDGRQTAIAFQMVSGVRYLDRGCAITAAAADADVCK
jgi:hypothetical protein